VIALFDVSFFQTCLHQFVETMNMLGIEKDYLASVDILWARGVGIVSKNVRLSVRRGDDEFL